MIFTLADITTQLSPACFNKGQLLFDDGCVAAPNIQRGGELITAVISQPGNRPLRVYVRMLKERNTVTIHGECSCAKRQNCEHVAAVLLSALDDRQAPPEVLDTASANRPRATSGTARTSHRNNQQVLLFILQLSESGVLVETCVARRLIHGGYSKIRQFDHGRVTTRSPARFLEPIDLELLAALDALPRTPDRYSHCLSGPQSVSLLKTMLSSGRCYFEIAEESDSLTQGPGRSLELHWQSNEFGYQQIRWCITPNAEALLPLPCPWYLDSKKNQCGPLDTPLPMGLIHELLTLAPVPPEQASKAHQRLTKTWPLAPLPLLQQFDTETAPHTQPVPCLRLTTVEGKTEEGERQDHNMACLSFYYGDIELTRHTPATRLKDGRIIQVPRSENAEHAAASQLRELGFEENDDWRRHSDDDCFFPAVNVHRSDVEAWLDFQAEAVPRLRALGWHIEFDHFRLRLVEAKHWLCDVEPLDQQDWFSIGLGVEVDGQRIDLLPILLEFLSNFPGDLPDNKNIASKYVFLPYGEGEHGIRLLRLPVKWLLPLLEILLEIYGSTTPADTRNLHLTRVQLTRLTALEQTENDPRLHWLADDNIQQLLQRLRDLDGIPAVEPPAGLCASLRPYQQRGLNWLQFLREYHLAGILADDMGLGKTLQALAHLLLEKEAGRSNLPSLVIAPTSLVFNWRNEANRFTPELTVLMLHGPQRNNHFPNIADHDLVITTYPLLTRDQDTLLAQSYHLLILDEAQVIKNPRVQAGRVARELTARHRLCLTGTPLENHLGELWSLFDFALPGLLGNSKQFGRCFRTPIENHGNQAATERLSRRIRPFLLRRSKQQVARELPDKTEIIQSVVLEGKQRELYETVRLAMHRRVRTEIERQGLARSHIVVLDALLKLRQVCCDPRLVKMDKAKHVKQSAKLDMLMELLPEMIEEGRRILLFSQFTTMLGLIENELSEAGISCVKLTGQTRDRETPVDKFQAGEVPLFLISLKAGGLGLNLTAADTVIHYDPWWNPAVERQATDRAHRIGQQQAVFVYKLVCDGTLEEKIYSMQQRKMALADGLYQHGGNHEPQWSQQDLDVLLGPLEDA